MSWGIRVFQLSFSIQAGFPGIGAGSDGYGHRSPQAPPPAGRWLLPDDINEVFAPFFLPSHDRCGDGGILGSGELPQPLAVVSAVAQSCRI